MSAIARYADWLLELIKGREGKSSLGMFLSIDYHIRSLDDCEICSFEANERRTDNVNV